MKVIAVIIQATGTISKPFRKYPGNILGKHKIKKQQKDGYIGHHTNTKESTNVKVQNIFHVQKNITCASNCKYRTAVTCDL